MLSVTLFSDGFESGSLPGAWTSKAVSANDTLTLDASVTHGGTASMKAVQVDAKGKNGARNASVAKTIPGQTTLDVRGWYHLSGPTNRGTVPVLGLYAQGQLVGQVTYKVDSPALAVYNPATATSYACSGPPGLNAWHSVELQYVLSAGTAGSFTVWVDGVQACSRTGIKTAPASGSTIDKVVTGIDGADSSAGLTVRVDDVAVSTGFIGP